MNSQTGTLFIVATPIGNLKDFSFRAVEVLNTVDLILAEDTRNASILLSHYQIKTPLSSMHAHNESRVVTSTVPKLCGGLQIAVISDAGTPLVSDPGFRLVFAAQQAGITISPIPGACAAISALSVAAIPTNTFIFEGFLPPKLSARESHLTELASENRTLVFYEAKHRIVAFLTSLQKVFGESRKITVARELTKLFESIYHGSVEEVIGHIKADSHAQKGEFVIVVEGAKKKDDNNDADVDRITRILLKDLSASQASKLAAQITQTSKNKCYQRALALKSAS